MFMHGNVMAAKNNLTCDTLLRKSMDKRPLNPGKSLPAWVKVQWVIEIFHHLKLPQDGIISAIDAPLLHCLTCLMVTLLTKESIKKETLGAET